MKWQHFVLRVAVASAVVIAFMFTIGLGSIVRTFAIGLCASFASHAVLLGVRRLRGDAKVSFTILAIVVAGGAGAGGFAVWDASAPTGQIRFRTVDQLMTYPGGNVGLRVRLHGFVELGSLQRCERGPSFMLIENAKRVRVELDGPAPETLADRAEVIAVGQLRHDGAVSNEFYFRADEVPAKCPSTYNTPDGPRPAAEFRG